MMTMVAMVMFWHNSRPNFDDLPQPQFTGSQGVSDVLVVEVIFKVLVVIGVHTLLQQGLELSLGASCLIPLFWGHVCILRIWWTIFPSTCSTLCLLALTPSQRQHQ